ncbi:MAG: hypothetical protein BGO81_19535 [Devosia sp. 66-22]|nr:MAG: hypothetical protein BGO81_19535 [Devosia sp. 66-22]
MVFAQKNMVVPCGKRLVRHSVAFGVCARPPLFEVGTDDFNQISRALCAVCIWLMMGIDHMMDDMVFDQLDGQAVDRASHRGDELQHIAAPQLCL